MQAEALALYTGPQTLKGLIPYLGPIFRTVCMRTKDRGACAHGIGHGLAVLAHGHTPRGHEKDGSLKYSNVSMLLELCAAAATTVSNGPIPHGLVQCRNGIVHG